MSIVIKEVQNNSDLRKFISYPYKLYAGNKYWCPQLRFDEKNTLNKMKNPAFEYCDAKFFLAYKDGKLAGRIAGIINNKSNEKWNEKHCRFGWIDFIDDEEVTASLLKAVEEWAIERGMESVHGPMGFTDMDNEGMLIKGFEELATLASIYNFPYYPVHLEKHGYLKDVDWVQYEFQIPAEPPEKLTKFAKLISEKYGLRVLKIKKSKDLLPYAKKMFTTLNKSFDNLYGFTPLNEKQMEMYTKQYFGFIVPDFVCLVIDKEDNVVGFGITMPSLTRALQKCNGRLFPFGFIYVLRALKKFDVLDMYLNGVIPEYQSKGVHTIYYDYLAHAYKKHKVKIAISNPQLEDNANALNVWKHYEGRQHLTRRAYIKHL